MLGNAHLYPHILVHLFSYFLETVSRGGIAGHETAELPASDPPSTRAPVCPLTHTRSEHSSTRCHFVLIFAHLIGEK